MKYIYVKFIIVLIILVGCESSNLVDPAIAINYEIEKRSHIKIVFENSYNTVIATIVDTVQDAGRYSIGYSVNDLAEGVYFYTIEAKGIGNDYYLKKTERVLMLKP